MDPVLCADGHTYERRAIEAWCDSSCCHHMLLARVVTRPHVTDARRSEGLLGSHAHRSDVVSIQRGSTLVTKQSSSRRACTSCAVSKTQAACASSAACSRGRWVACAPASSPPMQARAPQHAARLSPCVLEHNQPTDGKVPAC